jgi:hypothetical protein
MRRHKVLKVSALVDLLYEATVHLIFKNVFKALLALEREEEEEDGMGHHFEVPKRLHLLSSHMKMFSVRTALVGHDGSWELPACEQEEEEKEEEDREERASRQKVTWPAGTSATLHPQERAQPTHACVHSAYSANTSARSKGVRPTQDLAELSPLSQRLSVGVHASSRASGMLKFTGLFCSGIGLLICLF